MNNIGEGGWRRVNHQNQLARLSQRGTAQMQDRLDARWQRRQDHGQRRCARLSRVVHFIAVIPVRQVRFNSLEGTTRQIQ